MTDSTPEGFPIPVDSLLASMAELLKQKGAALEVAILAASTVRASAGNYDNWNGGQQGWNLVLSVELHLFSRLSEEDRDQAAKHLGETASMFFAEFQNDHFQNIHIAPRASPRPDWRKDAEAFVAGHNINNQGRVRSDNIASREVDGLLFRSQPEIYLYQALKSAGVTFAPLPVFVRGGSDYKRLEPDFVILKDGVVMVVEVDGDTYHLESPSAAHARLVPLDHEGAKIERVRADECGTALAAKECAARLLKILEKRIAQG